MSEESPSPLLSPGQRRLIGGSLTLLSLLAGAAALVGAFHVIGKLLALFSHVLWPLAAADRIAAYNKTADDRSLAAVARLIGYDQVEWTDEPDPFFNINTPEDWALAEDRLRASHAL